MSRWIRLNIDWHTTDWLVVLSAESRLAWVQLLCHVKAQGYAGKCKSVAPQVAERLWFVNEPSIRQMLQAAEQHGALVIDGDHWQVMKWRDYQGDETNATRQNRFKSARKGNGGNGEVTEVTLTETKTKTKTETIPPLPPWGDLPPDFHESCERWAAYRRRSRLKPWADITWNAQKSKWGSAAEFSSAVTAAIENGWQGLFPVSHPATSKLQRFKAIADAVEGGYV